MELSVFQKNILMYLLLHDNPISQKKISEYLNVSPFLIKKELTVIKTLCNCYNLELLNKQGMGLFVLGTFECKEKCLQSLKQISYKKGFSKEESFTIIVCILLHTSHFIKLNLFNVLLSMSNSSISYLIKSYQIETNMQHFDIKIVTKKGCGFKLIGNTIDKVGFLSSLIMNHIDRISFGRLLNGATVIQNDFTSEVFKIMNLKPEKNHAIQKLISISFPKSFLFDRDWLHCFVFLSLLYNIKKRGELNYSYNQNRLRELKNLILTKDYIKVFYIDTQESIQFYEWLCTFEGVLFGTMPEFHCFITREIRRLKIFEKNKIYQTLTPLNRQQIEQFTRKKTVDILHDFYAHNTKTNINHFHVLYLLFHYVKFNLTEICNVFKIIIELPSRDSGVELYLREQVFYKVSKIIRLKFVINEEIQNSFSNMKLYLSYLNSYDSKKLVYKLSISYPLTPTDIERINKSIRIFSLNSLKFTDDIS